MHTDIKVGLSCNNACIHCIMYPAIENRRKAKRQLNASTEDIFMSIDCAAGNGYKTITLTGGEISIRPDFYLLLEHAVSRNLNITVQTNARKLSEREGIEELSMMDREKVSFVIAVHGPSPEVHDAVTRRPGSFAETTKAVLLLREKGFTVVGKLVISKVNVNHLTSTVDLLHNLGISEALIAFPHAEDFSETRFFCVVPMYTEIRQPLMTCSAHAMASGLTLGFETIPYCVMGNATLWRGNVDLRHLQQELEPLPTLIKMPCEDDCIDWRISRKQIKFKGASCSACLLDKICEGPWKEYFDYYGFNEFIPISDMKVVGTFLDNFEFSGATL